MDWINQVRGVLYSGRNEAPGEQHFTDVSRVARDFDDVARAEPRPTLSQALAWAIRSPETPAFPDVVAHLFGEATGEQKAGLLNLLLGMKPPAAHDELSVETVRRLVREAQAADPSAVDRVCEYLAANPNLSKNLDVQTLAMAIGKVGERLQTPAKAMPANEPRA